ncbi:MAG: response regulator transcription factor [Flavobacteriales bacterium]
MSDSEYKILVVEDDGLICEDISSLLEVNGYSVIGMAHNGIQAIDMLLNRTPDFVLLDINLGVGLSGIDVAKVIHDKYKVPFVFLTSYDDEDTLKAAQEHSPYGYIVKPFQDRTLLTTIKMALFNHDSMKNKKVIDKEKLEAKTHKKFTSQELKTLKLLLDGLSYKNIGEELFISVNTVKHHVKNLYQKLEIKSRAELYTRLF